MKIAVYSIALNEAKFAERWAESAAEADYCVVADTGSTDDTVALLRCKGVDVHAISIKPWRFDRAREANLALVPADADVAICLDLDEVLLPGWRAALEQAWAPGATRLRHPFVWNWTADGQPLKTYGHRIHARHAYYWRYPIHEVQCPCPTWSRRWCGQGSPHPSPGRQQQAARAVPADAGAGRARGAGGCAPRALSWPRADVSSPMAGGGRGARAPSALARRDLGGRARRLHALSRALLRGAGAIPEAQAWLQRACAETPDAREPWIELARHCMKQRDWVGGVWAAQRALAITVPPKGVMHDSRAWALAPYDIGSVCAYYAGLMELSREWLAKALQLAPDDPRISGNRKFIFPEEAQRKTGA